VQIGTKIEAGVTELCPVPQISHGTVQAVYLRSRQIGVHERLAQRLRIRAEVGSSARVISSWARNPSVTVSGYHGSSKPMR